LPTVPFTPKFVRLNGLKALALNCNRTSCPSPFGHIAICFKTDRLSPRTGGWRNLPLYCDEVPNEFCPGMENAPALK